MDFNEDDLMYEDIGAGSDTGGSNILSQIFKSAASVGTSYFNSQTPRNVPVSPYGNINPATGAPYAYSTGAPTSSSPLLTVGILVAVGYFAFKFLVK